MKTKVLGVILLLLTLIVQGAILAVPDVIRLHIVANSDALQDQEVKELVRDRIVTELGPVFAEMEQEEVAYWIQHNKDIIQGIAQDELRKADFNYTAKVQFGVADYPTRLYGEVTYPAGKYRSLRIQLGEGVGRNWWCIMFPPLCFVRETVEVAEENSQEVIVKFWLWEKISLLIQRIRG